MFARTPRLLLRPGWIEDAPALAEAVTHEIVAMRLANLPWPYRLDDAAAYLGRERKHGEADFLVFLRTQGAPRLIGGAGIAERDGSHELGYWIVPSHWGLGFATEAARAVIATARNTLRIERLVAGHFLDNVASGRVLEKLGFVATGTETAYCRARGQDLPCKTFALDMRELAIAA